MKKTRVLNPCLFPPFIPHYTRRVSVGFPGALDKSAALANGVYLYGNSPQPNQLARHYVVFERHNGAVVGAFYSPQSEFTCFAGDMQGTRLEVEALVPEQPKPKAVSAQLASLYPLQRVSANDQRMLAVCKQETLALATRQ